MTAAILLSDIHDESASFKKSQFLITQFTLCILFCLSEYL